MNTSQQTLYSLKGAIQEAYRVNCNPSLTLQGIWENTSFTHQDILNLTQCIFNGNKQNTIQGECMMEDLKAMQKENKEEIPDSIKFRFIYLATSFTHLWCSIGIDGKMRLTNIKEPIVAYARPNEPLPYAWLHVNDKDGTIYLVKHMLPTDTGEPLKVKTYTSLSPRAGLIERRIAFDLSTNKPIQSVKGPYLQIASILFDKERCKVSIPKGGATSFMTFVVILTLGNDYILQNVYYNQCSDPKMFCELAILCHQGL